MFLYCGSVYNAVGISDYIGTNWRMIAEWSNWKGCGRKQWLPHWGTFLEFAWRDWDNVGNACQDSWFFVWESKGQLLNMSEVLSLESTWSVCVPELGFVLNAGYVWIVVKCKSMKLGLSLSYFFKYGWNFPVAVYSIICLTLCYYLFSYRFPGTQSCSRESQITMYTPLHGL
jgi:hypothetical protein